MDIATKTFLEIVNSACLLRFRPILMTTIVALLGGVPLMLSFGAGSELRRPLGYTIGGGLLLSEWLTLYTPVVYLYLTPPAASACIDRATVFRCARHRLIPVSVDHPTTIPPIVNHVFMDNLGRGLLANTRRRKGVAERECNRV